MVRSGPQGTVPGPGVRIKEGKSEREVFDRPLSTSITFALAIALCGRSGGRQPIWGKDDRGLPALKGHRQSPVGSLICQSLGPCKEAAMDISRTVTFSGRFFHQHVIACFLFRKFEVSHARACTHTACGNGAGRPVVWELGVS
jgi:hypothetical protein